MRVYHSSKYASPNPNPTPIVAYIIWAFVPDEKLHSWNITYYPSKYWAVALPSYVVVVLFLVVLGFVGASIITTPSLSSYDVLKGQLSVDHPLTSCGKGLSLIDMNETDFRLSGTNSR